MRTWFEIEETDVYLTVRETLLRRCTAWTAARGLVMVPSLAEALLDSRHFSTDGRLGYWTPAQVERALLHWIPGKVTASREDLLGAPETLRSLLRYLETTGLRDPRGAATAENEAAIDAAAAEFSAAIADPSRYGLAKTMALAAGLDNPDAIEAFLQGGPGALPDVDPEVVQEAMARQARLPALNAERKMTQLPVRLAAPEELATAAEHSKVAAQFRALAEWLGPQGRELTVAKNIRPADASTRRLTGPARAGDRRLPVRHPARRPAADPRRRRAGGPQLLADLARDPSRRPVVLLARRPDLRPPDATPEEATWMMIGSLLELLELGGPEAVIEQLSQFPSGQRKELVRTVLASGFPVPETLEEFRALVAAPILHGPPQHSPVAHVTRTQRTRPRRPRRR